jgi:hypothetical protein
LKEENMKATRGRLELLTQYCKSLLRALDAGIVLDEEDERSLGIVVEQISRIQHIALLRGQEQGLYARILEQVSGKKQRRTLNMIALGRQYHQQRQRPPEVQSPLDPELMGVGELVLPTRVVGILYRRQIFTVGQVIQYSPKDLLNMAGLGHVALQNIQDALQSYGLTLRD